MPVRPAHNTREKAAAGLFEDGGAGAEEGAEAVAPLVAVAVRADGQPVPLHLRACVCDCALTPLRPPSRGAGPSPPARRPQPQSRLSALLTEMHRVHGTSAPERMRGASMCRQPAAATARARARQCACRRQLAAAPARSKGRAGDSPSQPAPHSPSPPAPHSPSQPAPIPRHPNPAHESTARTTDGSRFCCFSGPYINRWPRPAGGERDTWSVAMALPPPCRSSSCVLCVRACVGARARVSTPPPLQQLPPSGARHAREALSRHGHPGHRHRGDKPWPGGAASRGGLSRHIRRAAPQAADAGPAIGGAGPLPASPPRRRRRGSPSSPLTEVLGPGRLSVTACWSTAACQ